MKDDAMNDSILRLRRELRASEELFHNIIDRSADGVLVIGLDGTVRFANPAALDLFCLSAEELVGKDFGYPVTSDRSVEIEILCPGGEVKVAEMRVAETRLRGENAWLATLRDVTEARRLKEVLNEALQSSEAARAEKEAVLSSVEEGMIFTDTAGRVVLMNRAAEMMLGTACREVIGLPAETFFSAHCIRKRIQTTFQEDNWEPFDIAMPPGLVPSESILQARVTPVLDKEKRRIGAVMVLQDVTRERELERMKSEFISNTAHELRTPLTTIVGYADLMVSGLDLSEEEKFEFIGIIRERAKTLKDMVEELLDLSRIESGQGLPLDLGRHTAAECASQLNPLVRMQGDRHTFEIDLEEDDLLLNVDRSKIIQVLENLISNAIKYSPEGGCIRLSGAPRKSNYEFCVADEGIGMTAEQVSRIFDRFYRADGSNSAVGGLGLGMSIVRGIVDAHGGDVGVQSTAGEGTRVCFTVPLHQS